MTRMTASDFNQRFSGLERLYGTAGMEIVRQMHVCVIGLGGVGSWAVEALARSGIKAITLIEYDDISLSNTNRQLHTLNDTVGKKKTAVMAQRVALINPYCQCHVIDDYINMENLADYLNKSHQYDYVIDAIDSIKFKAAVIYYCKRNKIPVITTGGAGGCTDPTLIKVADLSRTYNDALAAKVRSRLRYEYGYSKNPKRTFGVECVFSTQHKLYPKEDGTVGHEKPGIHGVHLDCRFGYGSAGFVTCVFAMIAVSRAINKTVKKRLAAQ